MLSLSCYVLLMFRSPISYVKCFSHISFSFLPYPTISRIGLSIVNLNYFVVLVAVVLQSLFFLLLFVQPHLSKDQLD